MDPIGYFEATSMAIADGFETLNGFIGMESPVAREEAARQAPVKSELETVGESVDRLAQRVDLSPRQESSRSKSPLYREISSDEAAWGILVALLFEHERVSGSTNTTCVSLNFQYYGLYAMEPSGACMQDFVVLGPYNRQESLDAIRETKVEGAVKEVQMPYLVNLQDV